MRERERLIARIRTLRRVLQGPGASPGTPATMDPAPRDASGEPDQLAALERRVAHLEGLLEGLQDSVHREFSRQGKRVAALEAQIQPGALGPALSKDARDRGL